MKNFITQFVRANNLRPGDGIVVRKRFLGLLKHYVIYLGQDRGQHYFIANMMGGVTVLNSGQISDFMGYMDPTRIIPFEGTDYEREKAVRRALNYPDRSNYNLLANNCEHYFNYTQTGQSYSEQTAAFGAGLAAVGTAMTINNALKDEEEDEDAGLKAAAGLLLVGLGLWAVKAATRD